MNHDTKVRDLERAYQADPSNKALGERYYTALLRQGTIQEQTIDSELYPFLWNDCIVFQEQKDSELGPTTNRRFTGIHGSGRTVDITIRRPSDTDSPADVSDIHRLRELSEKRLPKLIVPISCGQSDEYFFLINKVPVPGQLLSEVKLFEKPVPEIVARISQLAGTIAAAHSFELCPQSFVPARNLYVNNQGDIELHISGTHLFEAMHTSMALESFQGFSMPENQGWDLEILFYQSPEHVLEEPTDQRSLVFQLGIVLYEQLVGTRPFQEERVIQIVRSIMRAQPTPPGALREDITKAVNDVCMTALEKEPESRYKSLKAFAKALNQATVAST